MGWGMARILIVHHKWDLDVAEPLAAHLRRLGHSALLHAAGEPMASSPSDDLSPSVLVWSGALAVDDQALRQAATVSVQRRAVLIRADDTEPPPDIIDSAVVIIARSQQTHATFEAVVQALQLPRERGARLRRERTSPVWGVQAWRTWPRIVRAAIATGVVAGTAVGLCAALWAHQRDASQEMTLVRIGDQLRPRTAPSHEARALAAGLLDSNDPLVIQAALLSLGTVPEAEPLRARLASLEDTAWRHAETTADAAARLLAIETFRATFPSSPRLNGEATTATRLARDQILAAQQDLNTLGFEAGAGNGVLTPQTEAAVRAFRTQNALPATGAIDASLLSALGVAAQARREMAYASPRLGLLAQGAGHPTQQGPDTEAEALPRPPMARRGAVLGASAPAPEPLSVLQDCPACPSLVVLPQGQGQVGDAGSTGEPNERPARVVSLSYGLAIGRFEVTAREWDACVADNGCPPRPPNQAGPLPLLPASGVTYDEARLYVTWLQRLTGHGYRLPSEAEWEYAARAGAMATLVSDASEDLCVLGNVADSASTMPGREARCRDGFASLQAPVGQFRPNAFGLYDMIGNVWEWTEDCWHSSYQGAPLSPAPWLRGCETRQRVLRGGSYLTGPRYNRLSTRLPTQSDLRLTDVGFRVVRPVAD